MRFNPVAILTHDFIFMRIISFGMTLVQMTWLLLRRPTKENIRLCRHILKIKPNYSMLSVPRFANLYKLVQKANEMNLPGDIVECGVWNGGASALMGAAAREGLFARPRVQWLFDSFQGLPKPKDRDGRRLETYYFEGLAKGKFKHVKSIFEKLNVPLDSARVVTGWLDQTMLGNPVKGIAVLHIDTDWYDSVKVSLDHLYDKVAAGGFVVVDDYYPLRGCREAVEDFFAERKVDKAVLKKVDHSAVYFQKPLEEKTRAV